VEWSFDCHDWSAAQEVRRALGASLASAGASDAELADAQAVFSELLGNVVRHAGGSCDVVLEITDASPVLNVLDRGQGFALPAQHPVDTLAESGRGLFIVQTLAAAFDATQRPGGGTHARAVLHIQRSEQLPGHCGSRAATA
jgi:anti-sigma regulatory factor (Ser/Thr protein kinase)